MDLISFAWLHATAETGRADQVTRDGAEAAGATGTMLRPESGPSRARFAAAFRRARIVAM
jgi:hypothetical protein